MKKLKCTPISYLLLSSRSRNAMKTVGIHTVGDIIEYCDKRPHPGVALLHIATFGRKSLNITKKALLLYIRQNYPKQGRALAALPALRGVLVAAQRKADRQNA